MLSRWPRSLVPSCFMALTACQWKQPSHVDSCAQEAAGARGESRGGERRGPLFSILLLISIDVLVFFPLRARCGSFPPKNLWPLPCLFYSSAKRSTTRNKKPRHSTACLFSTCLFSLLSVKSNYVNWNVLLLHLCPKLTRLPEAAVHLGEINAWVWEGVRWCVCVSLCVCVCVCVCVFVFVLILEKKKSELEVIHWAIDGQNYGPVISTHLKSVTGLLHWFLLALKSRSHRLMG